VSLPARADPPAAPARKPSPERASQRVPQPARVPTGKRRAKPSPPAHPQKRKSSEARRKPAAQRSALRRKRHHLAFIVFASVIVGGMVLGLVALNAFVAQSSFRVDDLNARVDGLSQHYLVLEKQAAHLSAPGRIAAWARRHGMSPPHDGDIHILHVPGGSHAAPVGGSDSLLDPARLALKPIVQGSG